MVDVPIKLVDYKMFQRGKAGEHTRKTASYKNVNDTQKEAKPGEKSLWREKFRY